MSKYTLDEFYESVVVYKTQCTYELLHARWAPSCACALRTDAWCLSSTRSRAAPYIMERPGGRMCPRPGRCTPTCTAARDFSLLRPELGIE
jgi:hypothetical protein